MWIKASITQIVFKAIVASFRPRKPAFLRLLLIGIVVKFTTVEIYLLLVIKMQQFKDLGVFLIALPHLIEFDLVRGGVVRFFNLLSEITFILTNCRCIILAIYISLCGSNHYTIIIFFSCSHKHIQEVSCRAN